MNSLPLVSVCVITYNSSNTVIETLDSIFNQSYDNIELIVSDDYSSDNTIQICKNWIEEHRERFKNCVLLSSDSNNGTSANCKRCCEYATGEWIKIIAGDDLLAKSCISDNIGYISEHADAKVVFSNVIAFKNSIQNKNSYQYYFNEDKLQFFKLSTEEQYQIALKKNPVPAPSFFCDAGILKMHPYEDEYGLLDDAPKWIDLLGNGIHFYYLDKVTVYYRKNESVTSSHSRFYNPVYVDFLHKYYWRKRIDLIEEKDNKDVSDYQRRTLLMMDFAIFVLKNKKTRINNVFYTLFEKLVFRKRKE